jgi:hypothetical protein
MTEAAETRTGIDLDDHELVPDRFIQTLVRVARLWLDEHPTTGRAAQSKVLRRPAQESKTPTR